MRPVWTALLLLMPLAVALAGDPFVVDDATIVPAGACQLETWRKTHRRGHEVWLAPACNFTGNLELTLQRNRIRDEDDAVTRDTVIQGKTLFRELEKNGWGAGLTFGGTFHDTDLRQQNRLGGYYAFVPASFSFLDDRLLLHANLGGAVDRDARRKLATWGLGGEAALHERLWAVAEFYGNNRDNPSAQAGLRFVLKPEHIELDLLAGREHNNHGPTGRWWSIGLRLVTPRVLGL